MFDIYYNYIYLNPFKKVEYNIKSLNLMLDYEPFYIGEGKGNRYLDHLHGNLNNLQKWNKIKKILKDIDREEYIKKYILILNINSSKFDVLHYEKYFIELVGTKQNVYGVLKNGPLLNLKRGGISTPVLFGENNGFTKAIKNIDFLNKWKENVSKGQKLYFKNNLHWINNKTEVEVKKYKELLKSRFYDRDMEYFKQCISEHNKKRWNNYTEEQRIEKITKMQEGYKKSYESNGHWFHRLTKEEQEKHINTYNKWAAVKRYDKKEYEDFCEKRKGMNHWLNKMTLKDREEYLNNKQRGKNNWMNKLSVKDREEYLNMNNKWRKLKLKGGKEYEDFCNSRKGSNNPNYGNGQKISGKLNGKSEYFVIIHPDGNIIITHGNFYKYCEYYIKTYNIKPNPFRKTENFKKPDDEQKNGKWYIFKISKEEYLNKYNNIEIWNN